MRLLSRYLLRQLAAPFLFALGALTSLMLLSQVAKKFGALVGKGLPWGVIGEVFALSLPFIVAMTLPMAVLLAVLYAFSHLAADNEITAMRASGISVYQILTPVLAWGVFMSAFNFIFVDQVLPRSNARLRGLLIDIGRKKPTFELREQVINEVPPSQYFLRAGRIDAATGRLRDVTIYDVGGESSRRIIYADSGQMAYGEGQTDLNLRLYDGAIHQYRPADPLTFQLTYYRVNDIRVKDVYDELVRNSTETVRGDREMSTCEMLTVIREARTDRRNAAQDRHELLMNDLRSLLALPPLAAPPELSPDDRPSGYCRWLEQTRLGPAPSKTAQQPNSAHPLRVETQGARVQIQEPAPKPRRPVRGSKLPSAKVQGRPAPAGPAKAPPALNYPSARPLSARPQLSNWAQVATAADRAKDADRRADRFAVEVHKKWSISFACVSFVIIGIVMALRFPRGGIGLVIGGGLLVFAVHYVGLTAGESLADRGFVSPWEAMWAPNILLTVVGVIGLIRVSRESGSTRGGDFQEVIDAVKHLFRRIRRQPAPVESAK
ncbi:MAG TPA: LptF/LptG family permease [Gemmatimonadales bacterium]|nr:LptF/LptG family permease [Gemmatimonadales bacterium]